MYCVGLDIGYRNLKMVYGPKGQSRELSRPALACQEENLVLREGRRHYGDAKAVVVDGKSWAAMVDHHGVQGHVQHTHEGRIREPEYRALFYGALAALDVPVVDLLVTGLPVHQYLDRSTATYLRSMMLGKHVVRGSGNEAKTVWVKEVAVVPQPLGAYSEAFLSSPSKQLQLRRARTLVVDPGHYSTDVVVMNQASLEDMHSGTSLVAGQEVLEVMAKALDAEFGVKIPLARIEESLRNNRPVVQIGERTFELTKARAAAVEHLAKVRALIETKLRPRGDESAVVIDFVILAGGGSSLMRDVLEQFCHDKGCSLLVSENPVLANARGFWSMAVQKANAEAKTATA